MPRPPHAAAPGRGPARALLVAVVVATMPSAHPVGAQQAATPGRTFARSAYLEDSAFTSANVSVGDVNRDGHLDLVLAKGRHWPLVDRVLLGDGRGGFPRAQDLGRASDRSYSALLADLNGDGHLDVIVSNDRPDPGLVYLNRGDGTFTVGSTWGDAEWTTRQVQVADLDGDGHLDLIAANRSGSRPGASYICRGAGDGSFRQPCRSFATESSTSITPADVNGDGRLDLVVPHRDGGQSHVYLQQPRRDTLAFTRQPFGEPDATIRQTVVADLDQDGHLDLIAIDEDRGVRVYAGRGDGTFAAARSIGGEGGRPYALAVADLDADGATDVIVGYVRRRPEVLYNDGRGQRFTARPFGDAEGAAYGFAIADLDADGALDIAVARSDARSVLYFGTPATSATAPSVQTDAARRPAAGLRLTYLGNAGWEITDGTTVVLVDPFLTQFARWEPGAVPEGPDPDALYLPDTARIDKHISKADYVLVTHGHSDHALDAGYIARRTGAVILGTETIANLARAYRVPEPQLITVLGGEDYDFGTFSIKVIPSIHSALDEKRYFSNGRGIAGEAPRGLSAPLRRRDYQEGGSVAYLVRMGGHEVLVMGSMNYLEREMQGLRPDVALIGANSQRLQIHDFTGRLLRALGNPALVIPNHADAYGNPNPSPAALADRERFKQEVAAASPNSRYLYPTWFEPITLPPRDPAADAARARAAERRVIDPPGIAPLVPAYSVAVRDGEWVFVSGMTGVVPGSQDIIAGGVGPQTRQTLTNIRSAVEAAGASMADVAECTVFLTDMADYAAMNAEYITFFPEAPPARATLAVTALPRPAARVEIKCSARLRGR
jgi:reactive intermediate/imine deaminase